MNLHLLRTFAAVAEHKNFSRAAEITHVSQPAVSRAVRELEEQLEIVLVMRSGGQVRLTEAGAALYDYARAMFALEQAALADLCERRRLELGSVVIGASRTVNTYYLPPLIAQFLRQYPNIDLQIISENSEAIERRVLAYELDLAFVEGLPHDPRVERTFWREDQLLIIAAADHPLLARAEITAAELGEERWVVREQGSGTRTVGLSLLQEAGIEIRHMLELGGNGAIVRGVAAGLGLALVPTEAAREHLALGKVKAIDFPVQFSRPLFQIRLAHKPISPATRAFAEVVYGATHGISAEE